MKNRILINLALKLLSLVDESKIKCQNSWQHYQYKIKEFLD